MMEALKNYDSVTAANVIAAAAIASSKMHGDLRDSKLLVKYSSDVGAVLDEARLILNIIDGEISELQAKRLDEFLLKQLRSATLGGRDTSDILKVVGARGDLPLSLYKTAISDSFRRQFRPLGVRDNLVKRTLSDPFDYEHLLVDVDGYNDGVSFSLFVSEHESAKLGKHWLLVQTTRAGVKLIPQSAWWVHPSLVEFKNVNSPKNLLDAFIARFGSELFLDGIKVYEGMKIPKIPGEEFIFNMKSEVGDFQTLSWRARKEMDYVTLGLGYAININRYKTALASIGAI